ncbi:MAG: hypothetical protein HGJ94_06105 [Desulfosarcina sp.]|nr:hypothetical protein [Desulfosarcina sp.]MBC2745329.1 hypothetical protein [Desulfosarcina sp.]MBC2768234.1 hypothetical protein [Desulfosarcina sp.]
MNKIFIFLVAILLVLVIDLFHWEAPQIASQELTDNFTTNALAASNNSVQGLNFGFDADLHLQNNGTAVSTTTASVLDPVTMLLFGGGLIGLAGLGRKKI